MVVGGIVTFYCTKLGNLAQNSNKVLSKYASLLAR